MRICKDGRVWGQNNKTAGNHLGISTGRKYTYKKKPGGYNQGSANPMFGKRHTEAELRKMGGATRGSKHWNWKGGLTDLNHKVRHRIEFKLWRDAVFARDNWTCQKCGKQGVRLHPHHIKSFAQYPELQLAIDNGMTLCLECHKLTDNYAGKGETNARQD